MFYSYCFLLPNLVQSVTDGQVRPAAEKVAQQAEPTAAKANEQIMKGAKIVAENVGVYHPHHQCCFLVSIDLIHGSCILNSLF